VNDFVDSINVPAAVDIIIPYYRAFDYLCEAVESVCAQTFTNFRLLVIDDSPNDLIAREFIESLKDPRISYVSNPRNLGIIGNFELARLAVNANWGLILGHDDRLLPRFLEVMLSHASKNPSVALIQAQTQVINAEGDVYRPLVDKVKNLIWASTLYLAKKPPNGESDLKSTLVSSKLATASISIGDFLYFPTILWNKSVLRNYDFRKDLLITSDIDILMRVFSDGNQMLLVEEILAQYRRHQDSLSARSDLKLNRLREEVATYREAALLLKSHNLKSSAVLAQMRPSTRLFAWYEMLQCLFRGNIKIASKFLLLGLS